MDVDKSTFEDRINFPDLDITKFLMAIVVLAIHTHPFYSFSGLNQTINALFCLAVPFFFMASSYLCFLGMDISTLGDRYSVGAIRVRRTISRLLRLYLTWTVLFLPITVLGNILNQNSFIKVL